MKNNLILDLGINANGDKNGFYYVLLNKVKIKKGTYDQCNKFIDNYKPTNQLALFKL